MAKVFIVVVVLSFILLIRVGLYFQSQTPIPDGSHVRFTSILLGDPKFTGFSQGFSLFTPQDQRIYINTGRFPEYHYGQSLEVTGKVEVFERDKGSSGYVMDYPDVRIVSEYASPLYFLTYSFREKVASVFRMYLPYPYSALLMGVVFGVREGMPEGLTNAFVKTGVIHITAASGMNVTMLAGAICFIFAAFLNRKTAIIIAVGAIWFYAGIAGFDASIVRASIMATIAFSAALLGRQNTGWYALLLTGFLMIFISPRTIFDLGFQLSFFSTAGILLITPLLLEEKKKASKPEDATWFLTDDFKTTVSAQLATIPILFINFSEYSVFSVVINMLILWTIPPLMVLGGLASLFSLIFPILSAPFLYLSLPLLWYVVTVVEFSARVIPTFRFEGFNIVAAVVYYLLLGILIFYLRNNK